MLTDTHCHIHEANYPLSSAEVLKNARDSGVSRLICVGTDNHTSEEAIQFALRYDNVWAAIGVHPHEVKDGFDNISRLASGKSPKLVAIGEIGLDYFYTYSPRSVQIKVLEAQLQLARDNGLPVIFHVREAFADFWPVFDNFSGLKGVLHSFTDTDRNLEAALERGLYIGVNGISMFTKDPHQQAVFDRIPLEKLLLETDAPFLTPPPYRGKINEPAYVRYVAEYHAQRRGVELEHLARATSANASRLFSL